jgi:hypothetical protein
MSITLYLIETKARTTYACVGCGREIRLGALHFRHDPHPFARQFRGQPTTHWCRECILASHPGPKELVTGRIRVPAVKVLGRPLSEEQHVALSEGRRRTSDIQLLRPVRVHVVDVSDALFKWLVEDPNRLHGLTPAQFEGFTCDRLSAMGFEPKRVGPTQRKDGGVGILFWPREPASFPFLGAAQVKHHRDPQTHEGPSTVRDFAGAIATQPINAGIVVTNTSFSPDAQWFARAHARLVRLRDFDDMRRWLTGSFGDEAEWREIPKSIELCPGVVVNIR